MSTGVDCTVEQTFARQKNSTDMYQQGNVEYGKMTGNRKVKVEGTDKKMAYQYPHYMSLVEEDALQGNPKDSQPGEPSEENGEEVGDQPKAKQI